MPVTAGTAVTQATTTGEPVAGFPLRFTWHTGDWERLFDEQVKLLKADVARARSEGRLVLYLSCPISSRGGGWSGTNVDIARFVERSILKRWGEGFWVLNPAQYQLESKAGVGLLAAHAQRLGIDLEALQATSRPGGGDYMRMWTQVLVEDGADDCGRHFDAFYFLGPGDVFKFFTENGSETMTAGIQAYFARKAATDAGFRDAFPDGDIVWGRPPAAGAADPRGDWSQRRLDFLRFYALRASASFSLGSHDEWAIVRLLNERRRKGSVDPASDMADGDTGDQVATFFDGRQVDISATQAAVSRGYAA